MVIEKIKILGATLKLQAKQHCQLPYSLRKWAKWAELEVLLVAPKRSPVSLAHFKKVFSGKF